jgi:hypothetical protein
MNRKSWFDSGRCPAAPPVAPTKYVAIVYKYKMMDPVTGEHEVVSDTMVVEEGKVYTTLANMAGSSCFDIKLSACSFTLTTDPR